MRETVVRRSGAQNSGSIGPLCHCKRHFTLTLPLGCLKWVLGKCQGKLWQSAKAAWALAEWAIWLISWLSPILPTWNLAPPYKHTFCAWKVFHTAEVAPLILLLSKHSLQKILNLESEYYKYFATHILNSRLYNPHQNSVYLHFQKFYSNSLCQFSEKYVNWKKKIEISIWT